MKKSLCKRLLAVLLALALIVPSVIISSAPTSAEAATATEKKGGYTYNKLPYKTNKLAITKLSFTTGYFTADIKNNTGKALSGNSYIPFKCYNKEGEVVKTSSMYLFNVNKGETICRSIGIPDSTTKIIFGKAVVKAGTAQKNPAKTKKVEGIKTNVFPATFSKIKFTKVNIEKTKYGTEVTFTYKNNTQKAISDNSMVILKCYDSDGRVINGGGLYLKELNKGETTKVSFSFSTSLSEIYILGVNVKEGKASSSGKTKKIDGVVTNALPYKKDGIEVTDISFDGAKATLTFKNNTGKNITSTTSISYKSYDADGIVLKTGDFYLQPLNNGETGINYSYIAGSSDTVAKVIFDEVSIREASEKYAKASKTKNYDGLKMNVLPYTNNKLKLEFVEKEDRDYGQPYYHFTITNNTGKAVTSPSIKYRVFDKDGNVIDDSALYGSAMDKGETSTCKLLTKEDWAEIHFYAASWYEGTAFTSIKTAKIDGITTNKLPFTNKKLKLKSISFEKNYSYYTATVTVQNNTGETLERSSYLMYKCYDKDGNIIESGSGYGPQILNGETANFELSSIPEATVKVLFDFKL